MSCPIFLPPFFVRLLRVLVINHSFILINLTSQLSLRLNAFDLDIPDGLGYDMVSQAFNMNLVFQDKI